MLCYLIGRSQISITDALVHEIITECVSTTGGFVIQEKAKENQDMDTQIALPEKFGHYEVTKALMPIMIEIENYYYSVMPWKVLDNGYLCNFNMAKDGSNRTLSMIYLPDDHILYISDSPTNSPNLSIPTSSVEKLQNFIIWGSVNLTGGFIREQTKEDSSSTNVHKVAIQLQGNSSSNELITRLKPISTTLETTYYLAEPWKQDENGVLECQYFAQLKEEHKNMIIHFYYFPTPQVLAINFITSEAE